MQGLKPFTLFYKLRYGDVCNERHKRYDDQQDNYRVCPDPLPKCPDAVGVPIGSTMKTLLRISRTKGFSAFGAWRSVIGWNEWFSFFFLARIFLFNRLHQRKSIPASRTSNLSVKMSQHTGYAMLAYVYAQRHHPALVVGGHLPVPGLFRLRLWLRDRLLWRQLATLSYLTNDNLVFSDRGFEFLSAVETTDTISVKEIGNRPIQRTPAVQTCNDTEKENEIGLVKRLVADDLKGGFRGLR